MTAQANTHQHADGHTGLWVAGACSWCGAEDGTGLDPVPEPLNIRARRRCMYEQRGKPGCTNKSARLPSTILPGRDWDSYWCAEHQPVVAPTDVEGAA